jgi:hypothetical protein
VESKPEMFRFGELNVDRVRRILAHDTFARAGAAARQAAGIVRRLLAPRRFPGAEKFDCIVAGDIGCYALGVLPPYSAMDCCVCMGSSIGIGLGLRHVLPPAEAKRVVSVIGDSTFVHSGMTGLAEMIYNPPPTGHVVVILDNSTTAMTGHQEHPGTGRTLDHAADRQGDLRKSRPGAGHRRRARVPARQGLRGISANARRRRWPAKNWCSSSRAALRAGRQKHPRIRKMRARAARRPEVLAK